MLFLQAKNKIFNTAHLHKGVESLTLGAEYFALHT